MALVNGLTLTRQHTKAIGLAHKNKDKELETWPNGYIYKGEFKNSVWSGKGILTFPNGATYNGEWANGFMNGEGTFTWSDGKEKKGIWKNGKFQE